MKVALVSPYDPRPAAAADLALRGGVEEALDRCARGLVARGHDVTVVCSSTAPGDARDADGVRMVRVRRRGALFRNPVAALWRHVPADAEIVHVPATYPFVSDLIPWREAGRRAVVVDYHFDVHGTGPLMDAAAWAHERTLGRGMARATRVLCKSTDYARHSRVLSRIPDARIECVPNGVELDDFPLQAAPRSRDLLCVGRLVPYKGVDVLVRAMPLVHRATGARLTVVGEGPEAARLHALAHELGAPVHFRGRVAARELPGLYGAHRLTVLPSANGQEAFGIALLESMACGTPVVASDLPGVREVASLAGLTVRPGEPSALVEAIVRAWRDPLAFGDPAAIRARVAERYAWPRVIDRLEAAYRRALDDAAAARTRATARTTRAPAGGGA